MTMIEKMQNYVAGFFVRSQNTLNFYQLGVLDVYLEKAIQILCWQSTERTLGVFFCLNTLFWLLLMINLRFYGIISFLALILFVLDIWWREALYAEYKGEYSSIIKEVKNVFHIVINTLWNLRRDSPIVFYPSITLFFLILHMISRRTPGELLIYLVLLSMFFLPVAVRLLPKSVTEKFKIFFKCLSTKKSILAEDELIPFIQGKDFNRRDADLESLLTDRTADSITNSLASGITSMPSYLEVAGTPNDIEEEDLLPRAAKSGLSFTPGELSSDSDSESREIKFDSDHFNTSSSEDDPNSKDLTFPRDVQLAPREHSSEAVSMFRSMINSVGGNIVANMFQSAIYTRTAPPRTAALSEDDSDFEFVDPDEIGGDFQKDN